MKVIQISLIIIANILKKKTYNKEIQHAKEYEEENDVKYH